MPRQLAKKEKEVKPAGWVETSFIFHFVMCFRQSLPFQDCKSSANRSMKTARKQREQDSSPDYNVPNFIRIYMPLT